MSLWNPSFPDEAWQTGSNTTGQDSSLSELDQVTITPSNANTKAFHWTLASVFTKARKGMCQILLCRRGLVLRSGKTIRAHTSLAKATHVATGN